MTTEAENVLATVATLTNRQPWPEARRLALRFAEALDDPEDDDEDRQPELARVVLDWLERQQRKRKHDDFLGTE